VVFVIPILAGLVVGSWLVTAAIYSFFTDNGKSYSALSALDTNTTSSMTTGNYKYLSSYDTSQSRYKFRLFVLDEYLGEISLAFDNGATIAWEYDTRIWPDLAQYYGPGQHRGKRILYRFTNEYPILKNARSIVVETPPGSINAVMKSVLRKLQIAEGNDFDLVESDRVANRISTDIEAILAYDHTLGRLQFNSLFSGPIQFATTWLFFISTFLLVLGTTANWSKQFGENALELIPYLGFFGTLYGMADALELLGDADLTSAISKAITLGPVGSLLSIAVQTTMFALALYLVASFFSMIMHATTKRAFSIEEMGSADQIEKAH